MMSVPSSNQQGADRAAEIRARWEHVTRGPWAFDVDTRPALGGSAHYVVRATYKPDEHPWSFRFICWLNGGLGDADIVARDPERLRDDPQTHADAAAIAAAPDDIAWLLAERDALRAALQAAWDECEDFAGFEPVREQVRQALGIREFEATAEEPA